MVIDVLVELKAKNIDKTFSYKVPDNIKDKIKIGIRVLVPFAHQKLEGFVLKIHQQFECDYELKDIIEIIDLEPVINEEMLELGRYINKKTLANLISCYQTMLPSALKAKKNLIINKKYITLLKLNMDYNQAITLAKNDQQKDIINLFQCNDEIIKSTAVNISASAVKTLLTKDIIIEIKKEDYRLNNNCDKQKNTIILNLEQKNVVQKVVNSLDNFKPFLLHGVTGSGKTEAYMHIIDIVLKNNKEVIVLVPEISLTPQLVDNFKKRFGNNIAILHSRLSNGEKYDEWRKIERKEVSIVIGARSAIFAPFTNLGLIVIDEEHSATYKQENNPRYHAIDIALWRAKKHNCPVVLGSATPSIESYTRAKTNVYELLTLEKRINNSMPKVILVDMKKEIKKGFRILSEVLISNIENCINKNEQVILLLNRRGYSTIISCHDCGYIHKCPNCDIPLTYHKNNNMMRCHYCNYTTTKLLKCPECNSEDINNFGLGTEKLEEEINNRFENAKTIRMDVDTTSTKGSHERILKAFKDEKYNILIGTQMIAKGLDFAKVTLVGVINGDASLNIPDFRSGERTFQLLNQVSGRSGRDKLEGKVIIQTFNDEHYSIIKACENDYIGFYKEEMNIRKNLKYPPYYSIALIKIKGNNYDLVVTESNKIANYLRNKLMNNIILGPSSSMIPKINNIYYFQNIIKYKNVNEILDEITFINSKYKKNNKVTIELDFNPIRI